MHLYENYIEINKLRRKLHRLSKKLEAANISYTEHAFGISMQINQTTTDHQSIPLLQELIVHMKDLLEIRKPININ